MLRLELMCARRVARISIQHIGYLNAIGLYRISPSISALLRQQKPPVRQYSTLLSPLRTILAMAKTKPLEEAPIPGVDYEKRFTPQELLNQVQLLLNNRPALVKRQFETVGDQHSDAGFRFRVMQWNILSQALSTGKDNFVLCPDEALDWSTRRLRLLEEILLYDPHIVCLEEVDHFEFFHSSLKLVGYKGMFFPKPDSPALYVKGSNGPDGCAVFYKTDNLKIQQQQNVVLQNQSKELTNQVSICLTFQNIPKDEKTKVHEFCLAVTHLKAKLGWSQLRFEQGQYLMEYLESVTENRPLFVCGDFNAEVDEPVYSVFMNSHLELDSAYRSLQEDHSEPLYTTWKVRGAKDGQMNEVRRTIDYIWFSKKHSMVQALLNIPSGDDLGSAKLPSLKYGSDHLSLVADFVLF